MPAPEWGSFLSIVDGSLNVVPVSDLDQVVLKELMAENRGLTLLDLRERSDYSSVTTTSGECSDGRRRQQSLRPWPMLMTASVILLVIYPRGPGDGDPEAQRFPCAAAYG